ncbi:AMP-binding protein, partial [Polaromonas sp.]|uniref:AMP-binding protein n=1 Tax=Polaromonas sp. TaxID=1869339 RepID=UPI0035644D7F
MSSDFSAYDAKPWLPAYGTSIVADLPPARYSNLGQLVSSACERFADKKAFTCVVPNGMNGSLTYRELAEKSDAFATYLRKVCKLQAGDRVAVQLPNGLAYP